MSTVRKPNRRHVPELSEAAGGASCLGGGKVRYIDRRSAQLALLTLHRVAESDPERELLNVYRCPDCGDWHVGHDRLTEPTP